MLRRKNNSKRVYPTCRICGQTGVPLIAQRTDGDATHECQDPTICKRRQNITAVKGKLCSQWFCPEAGTLKCSCGLVHCPYHSGMSAHSDHSKEKLTCAERVEGLNI